jgi:hypothetical protein
MPPP